MAQAADELDLRVDRGAEVPIGTQLAWKLRNLVAGGALAAGARLPSVRELAVAAGVNVNTVRAVYGRLETEGLIRSEQGRGTFVAAPPTASGSGERAARHELRRQIAALEAELAHRARPAAASAAGGEPQGAPGGRLPTTEELRTIRDQLLHRLRELDTERAEVLRRLAELEQPAPELEQPAPEPARRSSVSLRGARVRWVGA